MSSVATISVVGGGLMSALNKPKTPTQLPADNFNAYGEKNTPSTGAISSRDSIFNVLNSPGFQSLLSRASGQYTDSLSQAANSPLLGQAKGYTGDVLGGKYLQSPVVKGFADQAYNNIISHGQDQNARTQAQFSNNGLGFSTGMMQAQRANNAATANTAAGARAGILSNNYQAERQMQQGAVSNAESLNAQTPNYLSQINSALYAPYASQAALTTGLLGSPVSSPQSTYVANPNTGQQVAGGVSNATGLYSILNGLKGKGSTGNSGGIPTETEWNPYGWAA